MYETLLWFRYFARLASLAAGLFAWSVGLMMLEVPSYLATAWLTSSSGMHGAWLSRRCVTYRRRMLKRLMRLNTAWNFSSGALTASSHRPASLIPQAEARKVLSEDDIPF